MPFLYRTPDLITYVKGEGGTSTKSDIFQLGLGWSLNCSLDAIQQSAQLTPSTSKISTCPC